MNFQSFNFIVFFLFVLFVVRFYLAEKPNAKKTFLLIASYYFYMCWDWRFAGIILLITLVNFVVGPRIAVAKTQLQKKAWLAVSLVLSLGVLAYFKYMNFLIESMGVLLTSIGFSPDFQLLNVVLPIGISFYTFQSISYTLDIYRGRTQPVDSLRDFSLFVAFFPQLVAGPIVRASHFLPQLSGESKERENGVEEGFALIIRGFIKKIAIADVLALHIVDPAFSNPSAFSPLFLLIGIYAYSYQIYMDFSGYTDIARGVARSLGYELQINFDRPYKASSVSNFWQRWHISMSSFFRDYLYFGLGGAKSGNVYVNLLITFIAVGVWHGAGWNFVVYGFLHGAFLGLERWRRNQRKRRGIPEPDYKGLRWGLQIFWIFNVIAFSRLLFRGGSVEAAQDYAEAMLVFGNTHLPLDVMGLTVLFVAVVSHYTPSRWTLDWKAAYTRVPAVAQGLVMVVVVFSLVALSSEQAPFIYFQF